MNHIEKVKKKILDLAVKYSRLKIVEIKELTGEKIDVITNIIQEMIENNEINGEYFSKSKSVVFDQQQNIQEIDRLRDTYKEWESELGGANSSYIKEIPFESFNYRKHSEPFIFISYSHKDTKEIFKDIEYLHNEGFNIWYDEGIRPSSDWTYEIATAIENCNYFIVFINQDALMSEMVLNEINYALDHEKPILLVFLENVNLPKGLRLRVNRKEKLNKFKLEESNFRKKINERLKSLKSR